jgi:hypothetical protein
MQRAQNSPHRNHPALGAAFALAVLRFNDEQRRQASAANLPMDVRAMQARAIMVFPYAPAYWTDLSDTYTLEYDWFSALMLIDVAFSLPTTSGMEGAPGVLRSKRELYTRIRRDFPDASLSATP